MRLNVEIAESIYDELRARADGAGRSMSDVVRELVVAWLRQERRAEADMLSLDERREQRRTR